ncbi:MAG: Tn3 family transposase, partial [Ktedonobacterales bacterium]|nr:Tn3 family transposase [Ktedonobacterales bacterium]
LKHEPKDFSLREMRQEIDRATELRPLAHLADRVLPHLDISNEGIKYYAALVSYYSIFRLRQVDTHTAYLYLLCFATHRYQRAHDHLLTCFVHKVKQYVDETKAVAKEGVAVNHSANQRDLSKAGAVLELFTAEEADAGTPFSAVQSQAFAILDRDRLDRVADHLAKTAVCDEVTLQWAYVDTLAPHFKRHLRPLLQAVDLSATHTEAPLLAAIAFLKRAFAKGQPLSQVPDGAVPTRCIPKRLRRYLYEQVSRERRRLRVDRYEFWVYRLVRQGLEAGDLSCRQSVRFRRFEDDLLSDDAWRDKEALIARLGLPVLAQPIAAHLADLERQLEERLQAVNRRIATGDNAHVQITRRGSTVRWTLFHPRSTPTVNHALFDRLPPRDIGSIVHFVDRRCPFLHHFDHLLPRFAKRRADAR